MSTTRRSRRPTRGSALLAVLWLSAGLAAIAFSLSTTVRGETERAATAMDGLRAYYLAAGAVDRASLEFLWSANMDPTKAPIPKGAAAVDYHFDSGDAHVEIIPEAAKLDVNFTSIETLDRLGLAMGLTPGRAQEIASAIDDWRRPNGGGMFDPYYLSLNPSFRAPHASFQEIEELLQVKGVTPDIFYGTYVAASQDAAGAGPRLTARPGLVDCLSVYGSKDRVDVNTASPAVLAAVGVPPQVVNALLERRRAAA